MQLGTIDRTHPERPLAAAATVAALAGLAGAISYGHMCQVAQEHGQAGWHAHAFPLSVDGLELVASLVLLADRRRGRRSGWLPRTALATGTAGSLAANIATATTDLISRIMARWPAVALLIAVKLLSGMLEHQESFDTLAPPVPDSPEHVSARGARPAAAAARGPGRAPSQEPRRDGQHPHDSEPMARNRRLHALGISPRHGRSTALLALAAEVPAAILAKTLGIHVQAAIQWQKISAEDWTAYAAGISDRDHATGLVVTPEGPDETMADQQPGQH